MMSKLMFGIMATLLLNPEATDGGGVATADAPTTDSAPSENDAAGEEEDDSGDELLQNEVDGKKVDINIEGVKFAKKGYKKDRGGKGVNLTGKFFASPRFTSVEVLLNHLDTQLKAQQRHKSQNEKEGITAEAIILDNFHSMIDNKLRTRVKGEVQEKFDSQKDKEAKENYIRELPDLLFAPEDAYKWIPGIREPGAGNQIKILSAKIAELKAAGKSMSDPEFLEVLMQLASVAAPKS